MDSIVIFMFLFDLFTLLICAFLLHQIIKDREILRNFVAAAEVYTHAFNEVAEFYKNAVTSWGEAKEVINNHAEALEAIKEVIKMDS